MRRFLVSRLVRSGFIVLGLIAVTFLLTRSFSDPARLMLPLDAPEADYQRMRADLGLDEPLVTQAARFVWDALRGDFGQSVWQRTDAFAVVLERVPATLALGVSAILLAVAVGFPLGLAAGRRPGSLADRIGTRISAVAISVPDYWLGHPADPALRGPAGMAADLGVRRGAVPRAPGGQPRPAPARTVCRDRPGGDARADGRAVRHQIGRAHV